jgi:hypothetical protein
MLLTFTVPLGAQCQNNFVEVHGKIECALKPDSKVLVSLIYSDKQKEGVGEENALDIRGDAFRGKVTFNTSSSNSFLKGDLWEEAKESPCSSDCRRWYRMGSQGTANRRVFSL